MTKTIATVLLMVITAPLLMGGTCNTVVRDEIVYRTELDFFEQASTQPADKLVEWINSHCTCDAGDWVGDMAVLCATSARLVQTIRFRVPYHKQMALYNASLIDKRPPQDPPEVPPSIDLCPPGE